jgi:hypothetical protein
MSLGMTGEGTVSSTTMDFVVTQYSKSGVENATFKLTDVSYNKKFNYNLFSAARCLKNGWTMSGSDQGIILNSKDGKTSLMFDIVIQTRKGLIFATMLKKHGEISGAEVEKVKAMTLKQAHNKLGHCDIEKTRRTAKRLKWKLSDGVMDPCPACAAGRLKQNSEMCPNLLAEIKLLRLAKDGIMILVP